MNLSYIATLILQSVANGYGYGFTIMDTTGLPSGTVYPALRRLEEAKYVTSHWEKDTVAHQELRPARKYYEITRTGAKALEEALQRYRLLAKNPVPSPQEGPEHV